MFTAQAVRPTATSPSQPLAWPVIGARRSMIPNQRQLHLLDVEALQSLAAGED